MCPICFPQSDFAVKKPSGIRLPRLVYKAYNFNWLFKVVLVCQRGENSKKSYFQDCFYGTRNVQCNLTVISHCHQGHTSLAKSLDQRLFYLTYFSCSELNIVLLLRGQRLQCLKMMLTPYDLFVFITVNLCIDLDYSSI